MWRYYVYLHRRATEGDPFYVGKGTVRKRKKSVDYERANNVKDGHNRHWKRIYAKHGRIVEILAMFKTDADAQDFERQQIAEIGRRDLGLGPLVNFTDGGEGHSGILVSDATRERRPALAKMPRTDAWIASIRRARHKGGNGGVVNRGDKLPESWKRNIAKTKCGTRNPMFGKTGAAHPRSRFVVDAADGTRYPSITAAAISEGMTVQNLHGMLTGRRANRTTMRLIG